jgi:hypothetical protein
LVGAGCVTEPVVNKAAIPSGEVLRAADCAPALQVYRQLLAMAPRVGSVVTNHLTPVRTEDEQARAAQYFAAQCQNRYVGHVRRAIIRCWNDAPDAETFQTCSQRF